MKVLGIYGSPRRAGNTDMLLDEALDGAKSAGADVSSIRCCDLKIAGCIECGGCDETGECVVDDDMQSVYPRLLEADAIILASPIFFYGITAQAKALIDRCQAMWCRRLLDKTPEEKRTYAGGCGYLIAAGATKGANLFQGAELVAKYFFDALDMRYEGGVLVKSVEGKGEIGKHPDFLKQAFELGRSAATARDLSSDAR
ncbi:MAG: flavodoxin family protein [Desulfomonile tiedjei]|nr:flavodoxin family protein [Desulfomonile tiedjei]